MNKVNWFKSARLWFQRHKWISIVTGIITAIVGIIRTRDFWKLLWIKSISSFPITFTLSVSWFSVVIVVALLLLLMSTYFLRECFFKTNKKRKLKDTKNEIANRLKEWQGLVKTLDDIEAKPKPQSKLPETFRQLHDPALMLAKIAYTNELINEYSTFLASCEKLKNYSDNQIAQFALEYPVIDGFAKILKTILLGNLKLDMSETEASFSSTRKVLNRIADTWENIYKTLEQIKYHCF